MSLEKGTMLFTPENYLVLPKKNIVRQKYQVRVQNLERVERVHVSVLLCVHHTECIQCSVESPVCLCSLLVLCPCVLIM